LATLEEYRLISKAKQVLQVARKIKRRDGLEFAVKNKRKKRKNFSMKIAFILFNIYSISKMQTGEQAELTSYANLLCTPFSLAGSIYMIHANFKTCSKSFSSKLVFCLAISDLLLTMCDLLEIFQPLNSQNCTIIGFLRIFGIYSNMLWTTQILTVLFLQFVFEYAGVDRLFPYLVLSNILGSLAPNLVTLYQQENGGELSFGVADSECFITPPSAFLWVLIIPFGTLLTVSSFLTAKVYLVFRNLETSMVNIEYKQLFMYPAVLVILNVPISLDYATKSQIFPLKFACMIMFKSIGLINALQFRRASNSKAKWMKESQQDVILRTLSQDGDSSFS